MNPGSFYHPDIYRDYITPIVGGKQFSCHQFSDKASTQADQFKLVMSFTVAFEF